MDRVLEHLEKKTKRLRYQEQRSKERKVRGNTPQIRQYKMTVACRIGTCTVPDSPAPVWLVAEIQAVKHPQ